MTDQKKPTLDEFQKKVNDATRNTLAKTQALVEQQASHLQSLQTLYNSKCEQYNALTEEKKLSDTFYIGVITSNQNVAKQKLEEFQALTDKFNTLEAEYDLLKAAATPIEEVTEEKSESV